MRYLLFKTILIAAALLAAPVTSCKCIIPPTVENSLSDETITDSYRVHVKKEIHPKHAPDGYIYYTARVKRVFKGKLRLPSERILIKTPAHSCGYRLQEETIFLLFLSEEKEELKKGLSTFSIQACDANKQFEDISEEERKALRAFRKGHVYIDGKDQEKFPNN
mmetsp:Transcript_11905/g.16447  ORF Transcript_11905/g.16447 Transcript_11905/m.16447 type:complete len:164 (-) Transcript_11905:426-917(-)|eukprot:CAMPEP_0185733952 /NCGR_PEP_ID=MMETSP1171-20130828/20995_1 /TAXON_ID=374046 /ORGANISM="Helicotheca tamensis, Strain CCMP826" /LENGTH=163 /DNA_ID=CAMNT_0028403817 /DNA_START=31 /DNA_END=522 /DNA_ORIENTATION=+